jgi:hypothetical protein
LKEKTLFFGFVLFGLGEKLGMSTLDKKKKKKKKKSKIDKKKKKKKKKKVMT